MAKCVRVQVAVLVAGATFIAGCGGGSQASGTSTAAPPTTTASTATSTAAGAPTDAGSRTAVELATCTSTAARSRLSPDGKARFRTLCKHAVNGAGASVAREAAEQCAQIIKQTVPSAAQAPLIAGCPESAQ